MECYQRKKLVHLIFGNQKRPNLIEIALLPFFSVIFVVSDLKFYLNAKLAVRSQSKPIR